MMQRYTTGVSVYALASLLYMTGAAAATESELTKAGSELKIAIERAERSLAEHQPGSGHTKQHMQQVLNILEGKGGRHFNSKTENPGDGTGVLRYLEAAEGQASSDAAAAIGHAKMFVEEAVQHAHRSVQGAGVEETHKHAALTAGLLEAAAGRDTSRSPVTGALAYAMAGRRP